MVKNNKFYHFINVKSNVSVYNLKYHQSSGIFKLHILAIMRSYALQNHCKFFDFENIKNF